MPFLHSMKDKCCFTLERSHLFERSMKSLWRTFKGEKKKANKSLKAVKGGGILTDPVLEYTKEDMGFNHQMGKKRCGGNVAFADGHVDTIMMPTESSYIRNLTRYLCQGFDVPHDGTRYTPNSSVDE